LPPQLPVNEAMKATVHSPAAGQGTLAPRVSRLTQAAIDHRPQAVAQRQLQQQLDARLAGPPPLLFSTAAPDSVVQRVRGSSSSASPHLVTQLQTPALWERVLAGQDGEFAEPAAPQHNQQAELWEQVLAGQDGAFAEPAEPQQHNQEAALWEQFLAGQDGAFAEPAAPHQAAAAPHQAAVPHQAADAPPGLLSRIINHPLATADTPGPTGGLAMLANLGASTASVALNAASNFNLSPETQKYLSPFQGVASAMAATSDLAGLTAEHRRNHDATWPVYFKNMAHTGADLASNVLQAGGSFAAPYYPEAAAYMSMAGNAIGMGVQAHSAYKSWNNSTPENLQKRNLVEATPKEDKAGSAVTGMDGLNNMVAAVNYGFLGANNNTSPSLLNKASTALAVAAPLATTGMTAYSLLNKNRESIIQKFGSIKNWVSERFSGSEEGIRQPLLAGNRRVNADDAV
jgi:hypothetical protein